MKKIFLLSIAILFLVNLSAPGWGHMMSDVELACPLCGAKDFYSVLMSYGSYIYRGPSRFQYVFWPLTEPECLYACQKCYFTCLMGGFKEFPKARIAAVKKTIEGTVLPVPDLSQKSDNLFRQGTYYYIPMSARIPIAEKVYKALGRSDREWCLFYRMAAFHYDEADMLDNAAESRKKALEYARKLIADKKEEDHLKESYLISGAMRHFLKDFEGARKDFEKGKKASFRDPSLSADDAKENEKYLNDLIDQFLDSPGEEIDMMLATGSGKLERAREILNRNPGLVTKYFKRGERDERGTLLHFAIRNEKGDIAKLLISRRADVNAKDERGETPLFEACRSSSGATQPCELMKILLDNGADINARNAKGMTPLLIAVDYYIHQRGEDEVRFLISRGADVNSKDNKKMTALHYAVLNKKENVVKILLSKGADVMAKDKAGKTALMYAKEKNLKNIIDLLRSQGAKE